jgi:hypothetical protein
VGAPPREPHERKSDALRLLSTPSVDCWVATSSPEGVAHLVPLSLCWTHEQVVLAVTRTSVTARNLEATGRARIGVGPTRDVVMIDAALERVQRVDVDQSLAASYAAQADWDPREDTGYVFVVLRPVRVQAWREANELSGRTLMRDGTWLD